MARPVGKEQRAVLPDVYFERHVIRFVKQVRREVIAQGLAGDRTVFVFLLGANETGHAGRGELGHIESAQCT